MEGGILVRSAKRSEKNSKDVISCIVCFVPNRITHILVGDTWYSPYCLLALYSTQLDRQSATGTMNACASANDSRRVFAENHSSWEGQMWRMVPRSRKKCGGKKFGGWFPDLNPQKSCKIFKNSCRIEKTLKIL